MYIRNSNLKKWYLLTFSCIWITTFWQILMIFLLSDFNYIAWFSHPRGSNFYSIYLFLTLNRPLITTWQEGNRSSSRWLKMSHTYPFKTSAVESGSSKENLSQPIFFKSHFENLGQISPVFFVNRRHGPFWATFLAKRRGKRSAPEKWEARERVDCCQIYYLLLRALWTSELKDALDRRALTVLPAV